MTSISSQLESVRIQTPVPGPKSQAMLARRRKVVSSGVGLGKSQIAALRAHGVFIEDVDGNVFLDFTGGIGCINTGHSEQKILNDAAEQMARLQHTCFQVTMYESYIGLCEALLPLTPCSSPQKKAALFNSGAEAVENAVKVARRATGRQAVVCFENAFHGRTLLTLSATSKVKPYKDGMGPFAPEVYQVSIPHSEDQADEALAKLDRFFKLTVAPERVACVLWEPIMGEGGFLIPPQKWVKGLEQRCRDHGIVLVADEIQTGFGRTGHWFASETFGVAPDLVTMAKSLSNGFPLSALVGRADLMDAVPPGGLGGTFGGNPISCAAALAVIHVQSQPGFFENARQRGDQWKKGLVDLSQQFSWLTHVRGKGAMVALDVVDSHGKPDGKKADQLVLACAQQGLLILTAGVDGHVVRSLMPLSIKGPQIHEALRLFQKACESLGG